MWPGSSPGRGTIRRRLLVPILHVYYTLSLPNEKHFYTLGNIRQYLSERGYTRGYIILVVLSFLLFVGLGGLSVVIVINVSRGYALVVLVISSG